MTEKSFTNEIAPRLEDGTDYGAAGKVLVRVGDRRLVWRPGRVYYSGMLNPHAYAPASLNVLWPREGGRMHSHSTLIFEGGRLSRKRLREHIDVIRKALKLGVNDLYPEDIDLKRTLVLYVVT